MGLFSFLNRKKETTNSVDPANHQNSSASLPGIPEGVPVGNDEFHNNDGVASGENGIYLLYRFLDRNYERKGYDDALINPDNTHLQQNTEALKNDLERTIRKVKTFYEDFIREINFHISSRSRSGMVDTVEELQVKKETAEDHIKQVRLIEEEVAHNKGVGQGIIISYTRGFKNGLAAISHHSIMKKNF
ncbi:MAG TPA: hypothetical protein VN726_02425 [Hanamia sp.]|nr:hypothetical protein [Hanamia sp.]